MSVFRTVEMDILRPPGAASETGGPGYGTQAHGVQAVSEAIPESLETLRFSDAGFVAGDTVYPPYVSDAFSIDRGLTLTADALGGVRAAGTLTLYNPGGVLDSTVMTRINDHLPVRIMTGHKLWDGGRSLWVDPPLSTLQPVFAGLGRSWQPGRSTISIAMLDATYWLAGEMPVTLYAGTGGLAGDANVAARAMPRLRGTACNITPVLIDSVNAVYQVSDGPAQITALYEGGYAGGIVAAGQVDDLYAQSPAPGSYLVQSGSAGTWFRLGTKPVYSITVDAVGQFRSGAAPVAVLDILRQLLVEDAGMPATCIDPLWAVSSDIAPWVGGWYWDGSQSVTGASAVTTLLSGLGLTLMPTRTGTLRPMVLRAPSRTIQPVARLSADVITELTEVALDTSLDPPTWRWRIGWQHNFTVQAAGATLHPRIAADRQSLIAQADRAAAWWSTDVRGRWRVPNDPALITTALARQADAQLVADRHGALWGEARRLWAVSVPQDYAWSLELGDAVWLSGPAVGLSGGAPGVIVGEQVRAADAVVTFQILV